MSRNRISNIFRRGLGPVALVLSLVTLAGCHQDMWNTPRYDTMRPSDFFEDGASARPIIAGTVTYAGAPRRWLSPIFAGLTGGPTVPPQDDEAFWSGKVNGQPVENNYFPVTAELLYRGQERFNAYCMPCHGMLGDGRGIIVQRGMPQPPSFHIDRLREVPDGYIFDVIQNGFGRMYSYASRVKPEDRWAVIAYVRALQASQNVDLNAPGLTDTDRNEILQGIEDTHRAAQAALSGEQHGHSDGHH